MISHDDETEANRSSQRLAWALTRFTSLRDFEIQSACILDEVLQQVIKGLYGHSKLRYCPFAMKGEFQNGGKHNFSCATPFCLIFFAKVSLASQLTFSRISL